MSFHPAAFSVRRWQFTLVVFFALIAVGISSLISIPKAEDPSFPLANYGIVAVLPGASPADVERLVVDPIEARVGVLDDVKRIRTEITDSLGVIQIEFREGVDPDRKRDDLLRETAALRPELPAELAQLEVKQFDTARVNVMEVALTGKGVSYHTLDTEARALKKRLEGVTGVRKIELAGLPKQEVTVTLDTDKLVALGINAGEVLNAIGNDAQNIPGGSVDVGARRFNVKTSGDFASIDEVRDVVVRATPRGAVRVRDVATVELGDAEASQIARFNGERAVLVAASMRAGDNLLTLRPRLEKEVDSFARALPPNIHLQHGFDQSKNVEHRLSGFSRDFSLAIALVLLTLLPLGPRASLVVMVSIPLSIAVGLGLLEAFGYSINQLSIVGFVIALGLLVDDSIVVVENIARHIREGATPKDAAVAATREITVSVVGCTATLILAFVPLLALPGSAGLFIRSMPMAVVLTVGASLFVSMTVVPFLASILLKPEAEHGNRVFQALTKGIEIVYRPVLNVALKFPKLALLVSMALFASSLALIPKIGFGLFPKAGIPQFMVEITTDDGSSLDATDRAARFVESVLARHHEIEHVSTVVGAGHPQIYYNVAPRNDRANAADVFAELHGIAQEHTEAYLERVREELRAYPGARITLREFENGPPLEAPIALRLLGDDQASLIAAAALVEKEVLATSGTRDVRNPGSDRRTDLKVAIDHDKAAVLGVAIPDVDRSVRLSLAGITAATYHEDGSDEARDIRVVLSHPKKSEIGGAPRADLSALDRTWLASSLGGGVPLSQVASLQLEPSPTTIRHHNRQRAITVTAQVAPGANTNSVTQNVIKKLSHVALPSGVRLVVAGEVENREESFSGMGMAILVAIFGVLAVLVLEFRTFRGTIIVASVMPLGALGGLVALFMSGYTISFTASIGFIALMGIEVKNSILLVDFTNQLRRQGMELDAAIQQAGEARFVPVLFTTLTALGGLIPLVMEKSALYSPLAVVLVGGLVSSTLLARVVTPVLYRLLPPDVSEDLVESAPVAIQAPAVA